MERSARRDVWRRVAVVVRMWARATIGTVRKRPAIVVAPLVTMGAIGALIILLGPLSQWATVAISDLEGKDRSDAVNATRQTLLAAAGGTIALVGLGFTARTYYLSRRGQLTDRYTRAIAQLASDRITERLGGIYALEHLMVESARDHTTVVEVLAAFIREQTDDGYGMLNRPVHVHRGPQPAYRTLSRDVQTALSVLGRRPERIERNVIDLSRADLCGADLAGLRLDRANLWGAKLRECIMHGVQLRRANLAWAVLDDSRMGRAELQGAHLVGAEMQRVTLEYAQLESADLSRAQLQGSGLEGTILRGAKLEGTNLSGAMFGDTGQPETGIGHNRVQDRPSGITPDQLANAILDEKTQLPIGLRDDLVRNYRTRFHQALVRRRQLLTSP